jgi:kinesin family protein C1
MAIEFHSYSPLLGNIRVFCRVRPALPSELASSSNSTIASIDYPDGREHREIHLSSTSESATGQERKEHWPFVFDRVRVNSGPSVHLYSYIPATQVFAPSSTQQDVFEEVSQLAQSCTDGYNVCIFAYGQTG